MKVQRLLKRLSMMLGVAQIAMTAIGAGVLALGCCLFFSKRIIRCWVKASTALNENLLLMELHCLTKDQMKDYARTMQ